MQYPTSSNKEDAKRIESTRLRRRMLEGNWESDIIQYMSSHLDASRQESWGVPSQSVNLFKSVVQQLSVIYFNEPVITNDLFTTESEEYLKSLKIFSKAVQHSQNVIGLRESFYRVFYNGTQVDVRLVTPDYICAKAADRDPNKLVRIEELVKKEYMEEDIWVWECWDIEYIPQLRIYSQDKSEDLTEYFVGTQFEYPYINPITGEAFLPYVIYHAQDKGEVFDACGWHELVYGTLELALLWSFFIHVVKDASWAQKYGVDVSLAGLSPSESGKRQTISTDPASILMFTSKDERTGGLSSFQNSVDIKGLSDSILEYAQTVIKNIGLGSTQSQQISSQSGIAIQLTQDVLRQQTKRFINGFEAGDIEMLSKVGLISNLFASENVPLLPIDSYKIRYPGLSLSQGEISEILNYYTPLIEMGVKSKVDLLQAIEGLTREEAVEKLKQNRADNLNL